MPSTVATSSEAPTPQLAPMATGWVGNAAVRAPKALGVMPIMVRPLVSKLMVVTIGSPAFDAPSTAARSSSSDDMVSIHRTSTPPSLSAIACSAKLSMASWWVSDPTGSRISPVGPMEPPT